MMAGKIPSNFEILFDMNIDLERNCSSDCTILFQQKAPKIYLIAIVTSCFSIIQTLIGIERFSEVLIPQFLGNFR